MIHWDQVAYGLRHSIGILIPIGALHESRDAHMVDYADGFPARKGAVQSMDRREKTFSPVARHLQGSMKCDDGTEHKCLQAN